jgi:hypothetical protein
MERASSSAGGVGITPHIPVWEKAQRDDGTFSRSDFRFDKEKNEYRCPNGKALRTTGKVHDGRTILYRASKFDCDPCPLAGCGKTLALGAVA